ncbi:CRISPR-associated helicase Cas3' [Desulforamulus ruminis]|uniref:CRISPR-associated helicase Cas3' n=1 Tax=Desulforamulus ruminis TaxID=1564 RepID=UPI001EE4171C|nr:CRISPR-associated helicase Cas3' [Desulforamulus ruminis]
MRSHPHLLLHEHIDQVRIAMRALQQLHSSRTVTFRIQDIMERTAVFHDLGKATDFFQEYIKDPESYKGNSSDKAHTGLSVFLTLIIAKEQEWDVRDALMVVAAISGHHSRLPTFSEQRVGFVDETKHAIERFANGSNVSTIQRQISSIDFEILSSEVNLEFNEIKTVRDSPQEITLLIRKALKFLNSKLIKENKNLYLQEAIAFRLKCQFIYSIMLEADKALLAVSDPAIYLMRPVNQWQSKWIDKRIGKPDVTDTNCLRQKIRNEVVEVIANKRDSRIFNLTAPTGAGKTLLAATWALKLRENTDNYWHPPKIIVVLPFLSVIDQTVNEYKKLLRVGGVENDSEWLLTSHSLSDRVYDSELTTGDNSFLVDTWRNDIIITTYDQFLFSLIEPYAKYQMRFHNLCDALIIMDEVQSLPCKLWQPLDEIFEQLTLVGNSKLLLMSATLPPFVKNAEPLLKNPNLYFAQCKRYCLRLRLNTHISLDEFCLELEERLDDWFTQRLRVLLTFNTRKSARKVRDYIDDWRKGKDEFADIPLFFISADVTPKNRLQSIDKIKEGNPCIVVSTQCIEAGVDIDMDLIIRDFAPLDCLIQIAGRCNREGGKETRGIIEIIDIVDEGKRYSEMIYDEVHLSVTRRLLKEYKEVLEEDILTLTDCYFKELSVRKDTGFIHLERFARWQDDVSIRELLRGKEKQQYTFLVIEQDPTLYQDMCEIMEIKNIWERREAWRRVAGRMAMVSVNVFVKPGFYPQQIAYEFKINTGLWILKDGYYSDDKGLVVEGETMIF